MHAACAWHRYFEAAAVMSQSGMNMLATALAGWPLVTFAPGLKYGLCQDGKHNSPAPAFALFPSAPSRYFSGTDRTRSWLPRALLASYASMAEQASHVSMVLALPADCDPLNPAFHALASYREIHVDGIAAITFSFLGVAVPQVPARPVQPIMPRL